MKKYNIMTSYHNNIRRGFLNQQDAAYLVLGNETAIKIKITLVILIEIQITSMLYVSRFCSFLLLTLSETFV